MFSCLVMLNYAGEAGDSRQQLTIVSRLDGRPRVVIWMREGVDNNRQPAAAHLRLRWATRQTIENGWCPDVPNLGKKIPISDADVQLFTIWRWSDISRITSQTITWTRAVISCRVNCCRRPVFQKNLVLTSQLTAVVLRPPQTPPPANSIFYNIDIGDLLTPIRRCSSRLQSRRFLMSDVYIGRTLVKTRFKKKRPLTAVNSTTNHCPCPGYR